MTEFVYAYSIGTEICGLCQTENEAIARSKMLTPIKIQGYWLAPDVFRIEIAELKESPFIKGIICYQNKQVGKPDWLVLPS